jgi:xylulokinase
MWENHQAQQFLRRSPSVHDPESFMPQPASNRDVPLLVGLDMGSTNVKAVIYEPDGTAVALHSVPAITHVPKPTWAFYEPDELWSLAVTALRGATAQLDDPRRIAGIAVASVGEAGVPLDRAGFPTYESIAWFDRRTIHQAAWLARHIGEDRIFEITGLSLQSIFTLNKILWIKENEPDAFARTVRWLHIADYIAFKLSGEAATDWSWASRTLIFDLKSFDWDAGILEAAGLPRSLMAPAVASGTKIGRVTTEAASATGLPVGATVGAGGQDHVCGALAAAVTRRGQMLDSMGTAEALFFPLNAPLRDPEMGRQGYTQGAHVMAGKYYVFGGLYTSGACVDWAHHSIGKEIELRQLLAEAGATPAGSNGAGFIPHLRLADSPHSDSRARAAFIGMTTDIDRGAMMRAVLEGLAYEARASIEPLLEYSGLRRMPEISVIGGSSKNELFLQIKASAINQTLRVLDLQEATALGAAMLSGIAAGVYRDAEHALETVRIHGRDIEPLADDVPLYDRYFTEVFTHMYEALRPLNHTIHAIFSGDVEDEA